MQSSVVPETRTYIPPAGPPFTTAEKVGHVGRGTLLAGGVRSDGSSSSAGWSDVLVEVWRRRRVESSILAPAIAEPTIILVLAGTVHAEERELGGGPWTGRTVTAGEFFLTTTCTPYEVRWRTLSPEDYQTMHVYIGLPVFAQAAKEVLGLAAGSGVPALREVFGEQDPVLAALLEPLRAEAMAPRPAAGATLFARGLAQSLAVHLLRTYAQPDPSGLSHSSQRGGLPAFKLRRVTDYLEAHLAEEVTVAQLAKEADLSEFHFARRFRQTTGFSPMQYLLRLRITRARHLLRETTRSVIEIGLEAGFTSPSYFAHLFRREVGVSPSEYRRDAGAAWPTF